jgi:flagellar hook-length control protein FliK
MTPFLSLDGMSAVDTSGAAPNASPLADGELGKAFLKQFAQQNSGQDESSDLAVQVAVDAEGATASPIAFLNLESEIDPDALAGASLDPAELAALEAADLQADLDIVPPAGTQEVDPHTVEDTDLDASTILTSAEDMSDVAPLENPQEAETEIAIDAEILTTAAEDSDASEGESVSKPDSSPIDSASLAQAAFGVPAKADNIEPDDTAVPSDAGEPALTRNVSELNVQAVPAGDADLTPGALQQTSEDVPETPLLATDSPSPDGAPQVRRASDPVPASASAASVPEPVQGLAIGAQTDASGPPSDVLQTSTLGVSAAPTAAPTIPTPVVQAGAAPAQPPATYVAVPADIASIISQELSSDTQSNRVRIQLDPPELGRVSLEFKFDSQGLQHVLVTADSAEAIRRIRAFHPDLVSVLDEHGLSSQDMTFREQASDQNPAQSWSSADTGALDEDSEPLPTVAAPLSQASPSRSATSGLDIRV